MFLRLTSEQAQGNGRSIGKVYALRCIGSIAAMTTEGPAAATRSISKGHYDHYR